MDETLRRSIATLAEIDEEPDAEFWKDVGSE
jgi:hypothetical protein